MSESYTGKKRVRKNFGRIDAVMDMPNLIDVQTGSYSSFINNVDNNGEHCEFGLEEVFKSIFPISDFAGNGSRKPEPLTIKSNDEIGEIAAAYNRMTSDISDYVGSIESLTRENTESYVQLDIARKIQYGLVPEKTTLHGAGFSACAVSQPAPFLWRWQRR